MKFDNGRNSGDLDADLGEWVLRFSAMGGLKKKVMGMITTDTKENDCARERSETMRLMTLVVEGGLKRKRMYGGGRKVGKKKKGWGRKGCVM